MSTRQHSVRMARAHRAGRQKSHRARPRLPVPVIYGLDPPFTRALGFQMARDDWLAWAAMPIDPNAWWEPNPPRDNTDSDSWGVWGQGGGWEGVELQDSTGTWGVASSWA
ncbi:hypothetical protein B0H11DRAFT_2238035 [Mycena galericulata]|nr:hypothetical protein B0H11DRAFT_2238035 [Mycena galericulata]